MTRRPPCVSRADLLRLMDEAGNMDGRLLAVCGYRVGADSGRQQNTGTEHHGESGAAASGKADSGEQPTAKLPPWRFIQALEYESRGPIPDAPQDTGIRAISNRELGVRYGKPGVRLRPLVPWPRLVPFLRSVLGRHLPSQRIHVRKLARMLERGVPLSSLPRVARRVWVPQGVILCDKHWREMAPFQDDVAHLTNMLRREMGKAAVKKVKVDGPPALRELSRLPPGAPVLALATLGQYEGDTKSLAAWVAAADYLRVRGHSLAALCPCPRRHWQERICSVWPLTVWDGRPRPSPGLSWQHPLAAHQESGEVTEKMLDLLAPAAFVERPLLRATRLRLGYPADVGTEREAWFHSLGWASSDSFGLVRPSQPQSADEHARRIERRGASPLVVEIDRLILRQHERHSLLIEFEARLRVFFSGGGSEAETDGVLMLLRRVVERLRHMNPDDDDRDDERSNLAPCFVEMVDRIPPQLRAHESLAELVSEGLGLAHRYLRTKRIEWAEGIRVDVAQRARESGVVAAGQIQGFRFGLRPGSDEEAGGKGLRLTPDAVENHLKEVPLGAISTARRSIYLTERTGRKELSHLIPTTGGAIPLAGSLGRAEGRFGMLSNLECVTYDRFARPPWARRMWYDKYGLAAEFRVKGVPFVLRWIPPGRFMMGSPEDEPERWEPEGPRHERVIRNGFWLGETAVTQAQWKAVTGANPSRFKGPDALPVEQVSWNDCHDYFRKLRALVPGLTFRLPREEEWEYACRAGTDTALWTGGITIRGENDAPELDAIAWYGGNSGRKLEVSNPVDADGWPKRQYPDKLAGTHVVKGKDANPWGLFDMLGNVWEWCHDPWDAKAYEKRVRGESPVEGGKDAGRVVRGGSWDFLARDCRAAARGRGEPGDRWSLLGFRLAAGQEPGAAEPPGSGATRRAEGRSQPPLPRERPEIF